MFLTEVSEDIGWKQSAKSIWSRKKYWQSVKCYWKGRALLKEEMYPIINKLINTCIDEEEKRRLKEHVRNEMHHYAEL